LILGFLLMLTAWAGPVLLPSASVDADALRAVGSGQRFALLVGPEGFDDPTLAPLRYTGDDARALRDVLEDPERGHFDKVWTLTGHDASTTPAVRAAMQNLADAVSSPDDTVFVYFSTHGSLHRDARGRLQQFLVLPDTHLDALEETGLSHAEVLSWLDTLPSRRKVLMLATCHSGQGKSRLPETLMRELSSTKGAPPLPALREVSEAVIIIGVCAWNETAQEAEGLGHDIYTWFFLEALSQGDLDGDGAVTVTEAHEHARDKTYAYTQGRQRPYARAEVLGADPIVLTGRRTQRSAATLGTYVASLDGYRVRVNGQLKGALPGLMTLDEGAHTVELLAPERDRVIARQRLKVDPGERVDVGDLVGKDLVRLGIGGGVQVFDQAAAGGPAGIVELHLPRWPGDRWELIAHGSGVVRWPHTTLQGGLVLEHILVPGAVQLRAGGGLQAFLLGAPGDPPLLAPSLAPELVLSTAWLPRGPVWARLSTSGSYVWHTDAGDWHHGWNLGGGLVVGASL
jgi:hypothetical protein